MSSSQSGTPEERVPFNRAPLFGTEFDYLRQTQDSGWLAGGGVFSNKCENWFASMLDARRTFLTSSCTASLEMSAILARITPGDEVIMPSFTFVSTANAFALRGARIVFVDIRPDTMNIDEALIERAITKETRAIVPVHYGGIGCEMDSIREIAEAHEILVIEDAAQGVGATYRDRPLGAFGQLAAFSFHETKNVTSGGEGGLTIVNNADLVDHAEIVRDMGTDRSRFTRGLIEKYQWVDIGGNFHTNEISAAFLWAQLQVLDDITEKRRDLWFNYRQAFQHLEDSGRVELQVVPETCRPNGHLFYLKVADKIERAQLIEHLAKRQIQAAFHYVPLHSSSAGRVLGRFVGEDVYTTRESERLVRLPMFYNMTALQQERTIQAVLDFFSNAA